LTSALVLGDPRPQHLVAAAPQPQAEAGEAGVEMDRIILAVGEREPGNGFPW